MPDAVAQANQWCKEHGLMPTVSVDNWKQLESYGHGLSLCVFILMLHDLKLLHLEDINDCLGDRCIKGVDWPGIGAKGKENKRVASDKNRGRKRDVLPYGNRPVSKSSSRSGSKAQVRSNRSGNAFSISRKTKAVKLRRPGRLGKGSPVSSRSTKGKTIGNCKSKPSKEGSHRKG